MTKDNLVEEMLEFGCSYELAQALAPVLLPLENDERGVAQALREHAPRIAEQIGILRRH